jgi:DNA-binding NtrC family response regulator
MDWIFAGRSAALHHLLDRCAMAARSALPVLIEGEEGAAHETIARYIHAQSPTGKDTFTVLRLPGPSRRRDAGLAQSLGGPGLPLLNRLLSANSGALFLQDMADLNHSGQRTLASFLKERLRPNSPGSLRLIAATSRDILAGTREGWFLPELQLAIGIMPVRLPPLRERGEDMQALAAALCTRPERSGPPKIGSPLSPAALAVLQALPWPRNYEEFATAIIESAEQAGAGPIEPRHLPEWIRPASKQRRRPPSDRVRAASRLTTDPVQDAFPLPRLNHLPTISALDPSGRIRPLGEVEADHIRIAFALYNGRAAEVARLLGIGRSTLYRKARALGLDRKATVGAPKGGVGTRRELDPLH